MASFSSRLHNWRLTTQEAILCQQQLRRHVDLQPLAARPRTIAGADISYNRFSDVGYATIIVLNYADTRPVYSASVEGRMEFPYIPGLLSFRELPILCRAWELLPEAPDVIMLDGHGIAHPRRMGIASHFGLLTDCPAMGCGKTVLVGTFEEPAPERGAFSPMVYKEEVVAVALRTKNKVKPVYVGPGHKMNLENARTIALETARGYRIPEPTRQAHLLVNRLRRGEVEPGLVRY